MNKIRFYLTLYFTKAVIKFMKLLGFNATNTPGEIALRLCPDILGYLKSAKITIAVTGTNGKTSTNNILSSTLKNSGYSVFDNGFGSNILSGIVTTLITYCDLKGQCQQDFACLEVDERSSAKVYRYLKPDYLICTNLQRDSLMRNANVDFIFNIIDQAIDPDTVLILNSDDLISSQLGKGRNKRYFFSVKQQTGEISRDNLVKDIVICPNCGENLQWDFVRYHSIGKGYCPKCGFKNETPQYVFDCCQDNIVTFTIDKESYRYPLVGYRTTDFYNQTAVITALNLCGVPYEKIVEGLSKTTVPAIRFTSYTFNDIEVLSILSKGMNPIAVSSSLDVVNKDTRRKAVILYLDDGHESKSSSEMISWIYDVDFQFLNDCNISQILVGGKRCEDYLVRMLYSGVDQALITTSFDPALTAQSLKLDGVEAVYILYDMYDIPNYQKIFANVKQLCLERGED
ncbi:MAG: MurT ligase domain-containing protein [Erysipelotrichaceae bacterium]